VTAVVQRPRWHHPWNRQDAENINHRPLRFTLALLRQGFPDGLGGDCPWQGPMVIHDLR